MGFTRRLPSGTRTIDLATPAPNLGLNLISNLSEGDPRYGLSIQNWIASPNGLRLREGFVEWAWNLPTDTTSLLQYNGRTSGSNKHFAVCASEIYDITTGGDMSGATPVQTGLSSSDTEWQHVMQTYTAGGANYLLTVNGFDSPRLFNGSTWTTCTQVAVPAAPGQFKTVDHTGTAVNITHFRDVCLSNQRLWFVSTDTTKGYYMDVGQVGGDLYAFEFGNEFPRGGKLHKLVAWSNDMGGQRGVQSYLVAISNLGDVVIYAGSNPADADEWGKVTSFQLGAPVGRRCTTPYYGDILITTQDGQFPLSKYIGASQVGNVDALTYLISPIFNNIIQASPDLQGYECVLYPGRNVLLLNVPQATTSRNYQFCYSLLGQGGWTQFTGWPAQCFGVFDDALFFGADNYVALAFYGFRDDASIDGSGGDSIIATCLSHFTDFREVLPLSTNKQAALVKPYMTTAQTNPTIWLGVNKDFELSQILGSATLNPTTGAIWDESTFDNPGSTWVGSLATYNEWATPIHDPGNYLAISLSVSSTNDLVWVSTQWKLKVGNSFG